MVGDRRHDVEGARHHGLDTIAVAWGYGDAAEHSEAGAWATASTPADVVRVLTAR
jgi:phosphoglycolate phosphatase